MMDKREMIMVRLTELLGAVSGIKGVFRDRGELPPRDKTPGIILLDGVERLRTEIANKNWATIVKALGVVLRRLTLDRNTRRHMVDGVVMPHGDNNGSL